MQSPPPRADSLSPIACLLAGGPPRCWMVIFNRCAPSPLRAAYPPIASVLADVGDGSLGPVPVQCRYGTLVVAPWDHSAVLWQSDKSAELIMTWPPTAAPQASRWAIP